MATTTDTSLQVKDIAPTLTVDDLQRSVTFFEDLGFTVDERWEDKGVLLGVMLRAGQTRIGLNQDDWKKGRDRKKGEGMRLYLNLNTPQQVDDVAARAKNAGIALTSEVHDTEWGSRAFEVTEPSGFKLTIGSGM
jgi:uncharacterized glyoxalase superfamily protein PhnB